MLASPVFRLSLFAAAAAVASLAAPSVLAAPGDKVGPEFSVTENSGNPYQLGLPSIARDRTGDFAVTWVYNGFDYDQNTRTGGIYVQRYRADGSTKDSTPILVQVSADTGSYQPLIAMDDSGAFVVRGQTGLIAITTDRAITFDATRQTQWLWTPLPKMSRSTPTSDDPSRWMLTEIS